MWSDSEKRAIAIVNLDAERLGRSARHVALAFREVKPDSLVCRLPEKLISKYLLEVISEGGRVLTAEHQEVPVGFLVFVRDNNLTLKFLRRHWCRVVSGLLFSARGTDKKLLFEVAGNALAMCGSNLSGEFRDEISLLAVKTGYTGKGIGEALIRNFLQRHRGLVRVKTNLLNHGAARFYRRVGFAEVGVVGVGIQRLVCFELNNCLGS